MSDAEHARFRKLLTDNGYFVTKPRQRIFSCLMNRPALSIKDLIALVNEHNQASVYRNILLFEKLGIITVLQLGWQSKVELSDRFQHHHHHMTCFSCGSVQILKDNVAIEKEIRHLAQESGFSITDHSLEIQGICHACKLSQKAPKQALKT